MEKFFLIFNFRFWLLLIELFYIPFGMCIGGLIYQLKHRKDEDQ